MYKVDNAVIMAAGTSSRFAPLSYETHKSLLTVRGEVRSSSAPATSMPAQKVMIESVNTTEVAERSQPNSASSGSTNSDQA